MAGAGGDLGHWSKWRFGLSSAVCFGAGEQARRELGAGQDEILVGRQRDLGEGRGAQRWRTKARFGKKGRARRPLAVRFGAALFWIGIWGKEGLGFL